MAIGATTHLVWGLLANLALCAEPALAVDRAVDDVTQAAEARPSASNYEVTWTNFIASAVAGDGSSALLYGAKIDAYAAVDGRDLSLRDGFTINAHAEANYGQNLNNVNSGVLLPVNTELAFPRSDELDFDLAISATQRIGRASLTVGIGPEQGGGSILHVGRGIWACAGDAHGSDRQSHHNISKESCISGPQNACPVLASGGGTT
jgi:hypothetical protein